MSFAPTVVAVVVVVVVVVEDEPVEVEDSESSVTDGSLEGGSSPEGNSGGGLWDSMGLGVAAMDEIGGNFRGGADCAILSCASLSFSDLDPCMLGNVLIL